MPVQGTPAFNAVAVLEIDEIDFRAGDPALVGRAAFVNARNGRTYGSTICRRWSKRTLDKLEELRTAMEEDIAALVFEEGSVAREGAELPAPGHFDAGGIAEHLNDAPSI